MRKVLLPLAGAGVLLAGLSAQAIPQGPTTINSDQAGVRYGSPTFIQEGLPTQTARAVSMGFVRSNTLLPLGGTEVINNPVPKDLKDLSGWTRDELQAGLQKEYTVDVVAVADFLYSPKGEQFLKAFSRTTTPPITASRRVWKLCAAPSFLILLTASCPATA
jgi:hypothetical protein